MAITEVMRKCKTVKEIAANLERAEQSIQAAKELAVRGYYDFAASCAYYAAFYAATAALLGEGLDLSKHSGVIASIHHIRGMSRPVCYQTFDSAENRWLIEVEL
jgi:uncharacterized protein (UPF0332 family)